MEGSDALAVLAEVAIGLAGFSGMVVAIRRREPAHSWETFRAVVLLVTAFWALMLALLPFAIHAFGVGGPNLWRLSSAVGVLSGALSVPILRSMPTDFPSSPYFREATAVFATITVVALGAHLANAFAIGSVGTFALFYTGVLLYIVSGAIQFLLVLVVRPPD